MRTKQQVRSTKRTEPGIACYTARKSASVFPTYYYPEEDPYADKNRVEGYLDSLGSEYIRNHLLKKLKDPRWTYTVCELFPEDEFPLPKGKTKRNTYMTYDQFEASLFSKAVIKQLERLGGIVTLESPRTCNGHTIPYTIQAFCDIYWTKGSTFYYPKEYAEFEFSGGRPADDEDSLPYMQEDPDLIIITEGQLIVGAKMKDKQQDMHDFNVYVFGDRTGFEGPYKISEFLSYCKII